VKPRSHLFRKYAVLFVALVSGALLVSGLVDLYFSYRESKAALVRLQREKAEAAASKIDQFIRTIEDQTGWTTQALFLPQGTFLERQRFDDLLRHSPSITEVSYLDAAGREQLRISRLGMDIVGSQVDYSTQPQFLEAKSGKTFFGPVYFRDQSEPYMTIAMSGKGQDAGVTVAEVNLKFIREVVSQIKIGRAGYAYVLDARGNLIAHPDMSLVLRKTSFASLPQVRDAITGSPKRDDTRDQATVARNLQGRQVLTASATIIPLGWLVFVEEPLAEAFAPLYSSMTRTGILLLVGLGVSVMASVLLARKMVNPIEALQARAVRIGAGALDERIEIRTGDELEALADQFNSMAVQLRESYANLEQKVEVRTRELTEALEQLKALGEVSQTVSSTLNLETVLTTIVARAVQLSGTTGGVVYEYDEATQEFHPRVSHHMSDELVEAVRAAAIRLGEGAVGRAAATRAPVQVPDIQDEREYGFPRLQPILARLGYRSLLAVPLLRDERIVGGLIVLRQEPGAFSAEVVNLLQTFGTQSVLAIENARLFRAVQEQAARLEAQTAELAEWNRTLEQRVKQQVAQLERLGRLKRFFSPHLAELIVTGGAQDPLQSHRREVTVVFLDLRGFTAFAEIAEPEEVMGVLRGFHAEMGKLILEHEGTLERFTGDGMMIFFNDPMPVPNPAERAVRMALAMRDSVGELTARWHKLGYALGCGMGLAHGYATIGAIGFEGRWDYGAIGSVTNLAARLCGEAKPGQILIPQGLLATVEGLVDVEPVGELFLKGFRRSITAYNVLRLRG
jgi:class 3 adenylate cyclase/HAMP domain-containing protein